jgi:hypothetical protein
VIVVAVLTLLPINKGKAAFFFDGGKVSFPFDYEKKASESFDDERRATSSFSFDKLFSKW